MAWTVPGETRFACTFGSHFCWYHEQF